MPGCSLPLAASLAFLVATFCSASFCSRFESVRLDRYARPSEFRKKTVAHMAVSRVRKLPAPDDPKTV